ncbi:MAG: hypothetical protein FWF38_07650, partial [Spirochaetaceae bacterium]|nr:hypothetical protein [Spirochaetaceae bacterium]
GVTATGTSSYNPVLVKYSSSGTALWARTITAGFSASAWFSAVAVDSVGNVYIAGMQIGTVTYAYGDGVTAAGTGTYFNPVLVKYNSSGTALWARTITAGSNAYAMFSAVAVDSVGDVYTAGSQNGSETYAYGDGVSATGTSTSFNPVLVKYNSSGTALWVRTVTAGFSAGFGAVAVDGNGNVYAAGSQNGTVTYAYGDGVTATGAGIFVTVKTSGENMSKTNRNLITFKN